MFMNSTVEPCSNRIVRYAICSIFYEEKGVRYILTIEAKITSRDLLVSVDH